MGEEGKKSFFKSTAFILIVVWIAMGVGLTFAVKYAVPQLDHSCVVWAEEQGIAVTSGGGHGGGHGSLGAACAALANEEIARKTKAEEEGVPVDHVAHANVAAAVLPLMHGMDLAWAWNIPNFLILFTLLFHFAKDPLAATLKTRREELETAIREAKQARAAAQDKLAEYEKRVANIDQDLEAVKEEMRALGQTDKERLIKEAEKLAERIKTDADFTAKQEVLMAKFKLREEAAKLAVEIAEKVIRETINEDDRDRLLGEYLDKVREQA